MKLQVNCIVGQTKTGRFEDTISYFENLNKEPLSYFGYSSPFSEKLNVVYSFNKIKKKEININLLKIFKFSKILTVFSFFLTVLLIFLFGFKVNNKKIFAISAFGSLICIIKNIFFCKNKIYYYCLDYYLYVSNKDIYDKLFSKIFQIIDLYLCKNCDAVFDITKRISKLRNNINNIDIKAYELNLGYSNLILDKKITKKKKNCLIFFGTHSANQDLNLILNIFEKFNDFSSYDLIICGHGPETNNFKKICRSSKYSDKINFLGFVEDYKLLQLIQISKFSFGLWKLSKNDNSFYADPGKVKLSILLGTPCIMSNHIFSYDIFGNKCGPVISCNSFGDIDFQKFFIDETNYKSYIDNCDNYIGECIINSHFDKYTKN